MKKDKRERIIEVAKELFIEKGYIETKVEDITKKMGISKGNFYTYFKSKEEVFHESIEIKKRENKEMLDSIDTLKEPAEILKEYFFFKNGKVLKSFPENKPTYSG